MTSRRIAAVSALAVIAAICLCATASAAPTTTSPPAATPGAAAPLPNLSDVLAYTSDKSPSGQAGAPLVKVTLNDGMDATFMLDTGTTACAVTDAMAAKLGLKPQPTNLAAAPLIMDGATAQAVKLTIKVGRFRFADFPTIVIKQSRFVQVLGHSLDGIIGMNLLSHFAIILEPSSHVLILQTPGKLSAKDVTAWGFKRAGTLPLTRAANGSYWTHIEMANDVRAASENLMIDTGATGSILSNQTAQALGLTPTKQGITIPFGNGVFVGDLALVPTVALGPDLGPDAPPGSKLTLRNAMFVYPSVPETFGASPHVLGMNILSGCSVLLDFPGLSMTLQPLKLRK